MRLPQSTYRTLSIPVVSITILIIALAAFGSLGAQAATQQLVCSPTDLGFGGITVGTSEAQLDVLTNTGQTSVTISSISVSGSDFRVSGVNLPVTLLAGARIGVTVTFTPTATGWTSGTVTFTSNSSNPSIQLAVGGTGLQSEAVTAAPGSLSFGQVAVGTKATLSVVLTNVRPWNKTLISVGTTGGAFSVSGPAFPVVLTPGKSIELSITFTPNALGLTSGKAFIYSGVRLNIPLTGTGTTIGQLSLSPTSVNFGSVELGTSTTQTSTLSATGGSVTISSATSSNAQFAIAGASFPLTINAGQSLPLKVAFAPKTAGNSSATLTFISNGKSPKVLESVVGTGAAPFVTLSWNPSTSQVSGYNVYRGTSAGVYSKINSTVESSTTYTDNAVTPGSTYYYAATAVNSSGQESGYSAPVRVVVP
jgi:hypothetical protein